jgi:hypothetical protein
MELSIKFVQRWGVTDSVGPWRKLGNTQHPAPRRSFSKGEGEFLFFQSEVKDTKLEGWVVYLKGGEGGEWEVKPKAPEPTDVEASRPKTMLFTRLCYEVYYIISFHHFLLYTSAYCVLPVQGDLILVLPGWGQTL